MVEKTEETATGRLEFLCIPHVRVPLPFSGGRWPLLPPNILLKGPQRLVGRLILQQLSQAQPLPHSTNVEASLLRDTEILGREKQVQAHTRGDGFRGSGDASEELPWTCGVGTSPETAGGSSGRGG